MRPITWIKKLGRSSSPTEIHPFPSDFPLDIWTVIVNVLQCSLIRNDLLPLLLTSRLMYSLVAPILYQTITLDGKYIMRAPEPTTYASARNLKRLHIALRNPFLSQYTTTIIGWDDLRKLSIICDCLRHLENLQRLDLSVSTDSELGCVFKAVPLAAPLTHLSIDVFHQCPSLSPFLSAHSSTLCFLRIRGRNLDTQQELFSSALPRLHTFEGPSQLWKDVAQVAPIKHLSTSEDLTPITETSGDEIFDNLTSLMFHFGDIDTAGTLLQNVTALRLWIGDDDDPEEDFLYLMKAPLTRIRYINFAGYTRPDGFAGIVQGLFQHHSSLGVIEFSEGEPVIKGEIYRYLRLDEQPKRLWRRESGLFEGWYDCVGEDFEKLCGQE